MSIFKTLDFQPMLIVDLFRPHKGKRLIAAHRQPGRTPFVGGSEACNSITGFSDVQPLFPGGWLTLVYNGSVGQTRLQPAPFFASDDVIALEPVVEGLSESVLLICAAIIQRECVNKYSYGTKLNLQRLSRQTVMVPAITHPDGTVEADWDGMNRLGEELISHAFSHARSACQTNPVDDDTLPELKFEPMLITDVFDSMAASKAWYDKSKLTLSGTVIHPFVSRAKASNGVESFYPEQAKAPEAGNAITIGLDTQTIGYQPVPFYTSQNIQVLRHDRLDEYTAPVLVTLIREQMGKFSWGGNGATLGRLKKTRIMVPVITDTAGNFVADWEGMAAYGRALRVRAERALNPALSLHP